MSRRQITEAQKVIQNNIFISDTIPNACTHEPTIILALIVTYLYAETHTLYVYTVHALAG